MPTYSLSLSLSLSLSPLLLLPFLCVYMLNNTVCNRNNQQTATDNKHSKQGTFDARFNYHLLQESKLKLRTVKMEVIKEEEGLGKEEEEE